MLGVLWMDPVKNKSCGYFKWYDEPMNERARDVINELKEENKRLVAENQNSGNSGRRNFEGEVAELWAELKKAQYKQERELNSNKKDESSNNCCFIFLGVIGNLLFMM